MTRNEEIIDGLKGLACSEWNGEDTYGAQVCRVAADEIARLTAQVEALERALRANDDERCYSCKSFYVLDSEEKCSECEPCFDGDRWQFAENRFAGG